MLEAAAPGSLPTIEIARLVAERIQIRFHSTADFRKWAKNCINRELHRQWTAGKVGREQTSGAETRWPALPVHQATSLQELEGLSGQAVKAP